MKILLLAASLLLNCASLGFANFSGEYIGEGRLTIKRENNSRTMNCDLFQFVVIDGLNVFSSDSIRGRFDCADRGGNYGLPRYIADSNGNLFNEQNINIGVKTDRRVVVEDVEAGYRLEISATEIGQFIFEETITFSDGTRHIYFGRMRLENFGRFD
jgi:hypothetical protein